jgi:hypothetical protein
MGCYLCAYLSPQRPKRPAPLPAGTGAAAHDDLGTCSSCAVWACSQHGTQAVIRWTDRPADQLDPPLRGARVVAIRRDLDGRATVAADCLTLLRGGLGPKATVPGVQCSPDTPPWYEAASTGPIVAAVAGLVTIAFSVFNIGDKFGFGKSPAGP